MKKKYLSIGAYLLFSTILLIGCQKKEKVEIKNNFEKTKKKVEKNSVHKKGIEHIADYQKQIRKGIYEEKSAYENGYLIKEYNKAKKQKIARKSTSAITPVFTERGPNNVPGRSRGIAIDPNNSNRWFIGTVGGGIWRTENAGSTWTNLTDFKMPNLSTSTIVMSQTNSNVLYVGTGEPFGNLGNIGGAGVFKTTNGGSSWQSLAGTAAFGDIGRMIINPSNDSNVLIATSSGIYRTTNGGSSWLQTYNSAGNRVQDLDADPSNFNIQYGSVNGLGIVKSTDGGVTWSTALNTANYNANHSRFEMDVSSVDPSVLVVCAYSSSGGTVSPTTDLYVSKNGGTTFTNLTAPAGAIVDRLDLVGGQGWYDNIVLAHPYNQNVFYVGGVELFKVTINNDNSFTALEMAATNQNSNLVQKNTNVHVDQHGLKVIKGANNTFRIVLANDGGVFLSNSDTDPGVDEGDWSNSVTGKNSTQFYGAAKQNGFNNYLAGAQDNGCWISLNNDATKDKSFIEVFGGDGFEVIWHYDNPQDFIVTSQNNVIGRYVNFAYSDFTRLEGSPIFYTKVTNSDNNPNTVFSVSGDGVYRSTDFAANWKLTPITANFAPGATSSLNVKVSTADPNVVWAGAAMTESGSFVLHKSEDNGQTFSPASIYNNPNGSHNLFISGIATSYSERNRAYALFSSSGVPKILKTENLGASWSDITGFETNANTGFPDVAVHSVLEMPFNKNIIWAGTDIGIFQTENGGTSWSILSGFPSVAAYDMKVVNDQVVIATHGRGVWSATISELNSYSPPSHLAFSNSSASQKGIESLKATINYDVSNDDVNRVKIFIDDVEQTEVVQDFNTGINYTFDTSDLSEGVHKVGVQLFNDTNNTQTPIGSSEFTVIDFKTPSTLLKITQFSGDNVFAFNSSFKLDNLGGSVTDMVLNNSDHPYKNSTTYSAMLRQPLILSASNDTFEIVDAAIVEPYTTDLNDLNSFYDYVIIEGSTDLINWKTIDKYDARRFPEWLTEYNKGTNATITDNLLKRQTVSLSSKGFTVGETIAIRLSLVTDPGTTSYGWAIRSINDNAVASVNEVIDGKRIFTIYPTISQGSFTIFAKNTLGKSKLQIVDVTGKSVYNDILDFNYNEKHEVSVNLNSGIYVMQIIDENNKISHQKIIIE